MKKVTILSMHTGYGGAENSIATLANNICSKYDVEIVSLYNLYNKEVYPIDKKVKITYLINSDIAIRVDKYKKLLKSKRILKLFKVLFKDYNIHLVRLIKDTFLSIKNTIDKRRLMIKYIKKMDTDIVISTRIEYNYFVSKYAKGVKKIAWEHNHGDINHIKDVIDSCYNIDNLILVSNELYNLYNSIEHHPKLSFIPNAIDEMPSDKSKLESNKLISVGRLVTIKGYDDMIDVMNFVHDINPKITLEIIGDGDLLDELVTKTKNNKLDKVIKFVGFKDKKYINKKLADASLFISTSHSESFGLVAIEAMASGVPVVAFDSAEGFKELIDESNGFLIQNRNKIEMANKIIELLNNRKELKKMGTKAYNRSLHYTKDKVLSSWIDVFEGGKK